MNYARLKSKNILFITNDKHSIGNVQPVLNLAFNETIVTDDHTSVFETYFSNSRKEQTIDMTVIDLDLCGLGLVKEIRDKTLRMPIILLASSYENISAIDIAKYQIFYCFNKTYTATDLLNQVNNAMEVVTKRKLRSYLDQVAIVTGTDLKGNIIYANDMFSTVSGYSKDEIIGENHSILRHPSSSKEMFNKMWEELKSGKTWHGITKNKTKTNEVYYVDSTVFPIYDSNENLIEFLSIKFVVTDEAEQISKLKKYILSQKTEQIKSNKVVTKLLQDTKRQTILEEQHKTVHLRELIIALEDDLKSAKRAKAEVTARSLRFENKIKDLEKKEKEEFINSKVQMKDVISKNQDATKHNSAILEDNENLKKKMETAHHNILKLQHTVDEYRKKILNLNDVINSKDKTISNYKMKHGDLIL